MKQLPKKITLRRLVSMGACKGALRLFKATFPETYRTGVEVTARNFNTARRVGFALTWFFDAIELPACVHGGLCPCSRQRVETGAQIMAVWRKEQKERQS
jgi:hypothetical protein